MSNITSNLTPTAATYDALDRAFNFFNDRLFESRLPPVMITMQRKRGARGYFWAEQFKARTDGHTMHEIALNPDTMDRTVEAVLSTLVHEMVHLKQEEYGTPGKGSMHNKEWAAMMEEVGLIPSHNGEPGGKKTGRRVTHYIEPDGLFEQACADLVAMGIDLLYFTQPAVSTGKEKKKDLSKVKRTCPCCGANAWAKQGLKMICGECEETMEEEEV